MLKIYIIEWLSLVFKFLHIITGIAWIGASFYFNWLENKLNRVANRDDIAGHLWAVHGGGFYYLEKYKKYPKELPQELHWFKWEAYFTAISGMLLFSTIYYLNPTSQLILSGSDIPPVLSVFLSIIGIIIFWLIYDALCKSSVVKNNVLFVVIMTLIIALSAYLYGLIYNPKAVYIQLGAMLGITMVANVFFVIIPVQKLLVKSCQEQSEVSSELGFRGYTRSRHNNYFTLPVLLAMISVHYPMLSSTEYSWIVLVFVFMLTTIVRHYFNLRGVGKHNNSLIALIVILTIGLGYILSPKILTQSDNSVNYSEVTSIIKAHCISCHSKTPTDKTFVSAPNGFVLDAKEDIIKSKLLIYNRAVATNSMPLGNATNMTKEQRAILGNWIMQQHK